MSEKTLPGWAKTALFAFFPSGLALLMGVSFPVVLMAAFAAMPATVLVWFVFSKNNALPERFLPLVYAICFALFCQVEFLGEDSLQQECEPSFTVHC